MEQLLAQALGQLRRIWNYRWIGVGFAWLVGLVALGVGFAIPDQYQAQARIYVDTQSILKPLMSGLAVQPNVEQQVTMLSKTLISRPNVEKLVRMADLDLKKQTKAEQEALVENLMKQMSIATTGRDNLYTLQYADADPETAKRVVQSLVSIFVESSLGASRKDTATATTFLNEQIKSYEAKLEEAEQRLKEFRLRNIETMAADGKDSTARLGEMHAQLERARLELREAENARDAARRQLTGEKGSAGTEVPLSALATPELDARITEMRRSLDGLLQRYTDAHPDVTQARRLIAELEEQRRREQAELRKQIQAAPLSGVSANASPALQEMQRMVAGAEVQVATLKARVAEFTQRYAAAVASLKTAPQLEAEAAQLNRDYEVHKKNYNDLVARRESAAMSGELDVASGVADFRLIDPPRVTPRPVSPNRYLLLAAGLAAALGAGLFAAFAAAQLRPVFYDSQELRMKTELPVLGVVSRLTGPVELRRRRMDRLRVLGAVTSLVLMFGLAMVFVAIMAARHAG